MSSERAGTPPMMADVECSPSRRVDGRLHSWKFDGDDPYIECVYCGQYQDALNGRVIRPGRTNG